MSKDGTMIWESVLIFGTWYTVESDVLLTAGSMTQISATFIGGGAHVDDVIRGHAVFLYIFN